MGWDMQSGICKKRFLKPAKAVPAGWFGELCRDRSTTEHGCLAEASRNLQPFCPSPSPFFHCLYIFSHLQAPVSPQKPLVPMTTPHTAIHTQCLHTADLCADQISQPRITLSYSLSSLQRSICPPPTRPCSPSLQASGAVCDLAECHWECPLIE